MVGDGRICQETNGYFSVLLGLLDNIYVSVMENIYSHPNINTFFRHFILISLII